MKNIYKDENSIIFQNRFYDLSSGLLLSPIETQNYVIVQVAESYYGRSCSIDDHLQYCDLEITFPLTGGLNCSTHMVFEKLGKHEIYLSFQEDIHGLLIRKSCRFQTLAINFKAGPCHPLLDHLKHKFSTQRKLYLPDISTCMTSIMAEFMSPQLPFSLNYMDSLITSILVILSRSGSAKENVDILSAEEKLVTIINYMDSHFFEICSLDELSTRFGYTCSHMCKLFKKTYSITPGEYLLTKKMDHAALLLQEGKNLVQIAELLGYSTPYNFSRAFKAFHGVSPKNYLKQLTDSLVD